MSLSLGTKTLFLNKIMPSSRVQSDNAVLRGGVDHSLRHLIIPLMKSLFDDKVWIWLRRSVAIRDINCSLGNMVTSSSSSSPLV
jgi:hypothetical protein